MKIWNRYGLRKRLVRGDSMLLFLTFRCTLKCDYCALKYIDGKYPESDEITLSEWKRIVKSFPRKIREVKITGGEPMLMPWFPEFVNWLIDEGYFVLVITNMTLKKEIKESYRLIFIATNHEGSKFQLPYYRKHRVKVDKIGETKDLCFREYGSTCTGYIYSPEGRLFTHVNEMYIHHTGGKC